MSYKFKSITWFPKEDDVEGIMGFFDLEKKQYVGSILTGHPEKIMVLMDGILENTKVHMGTFNSVDEAKEAISKEIESYVSDIISMYTIEPGIVRSREDMYDRLSDASSSLGSISFSSAYSNSHDPLVSDIAPFEEFHQIHTKLAEWAAEFKKRIDGNN